MCVRFWVTRVLWTDSGVCHSSWLWFNPICGERIEWRHKMTYLMILHLRYNPPWSRRRFTLFHLFPQGALEYPITPLIMCRSPFHMNKWGAQFTSALPTKHSGMHLLPFKGPIPRADSYQEPAEAFIWSANLVPVNTYYEKLNFTKV